MLLICTLRGRANRFVPPYTQNVLFGGAGEKLLKAGTGRPGDDVLAVGDGLDVGVAVGVGVLEGEGVGVTVAVGAGTSAPGARRSAITVKRGPVGPDQSTRLLSLKVPYVG
jgi:hypothetical protein